MKKSVRNLFELFWLQDFSNPITGATNEAGVAVQGGGPGRGLNLSVNGVRPTKLVDKIPDVPMKKWWSAAAGKCSVTRPACPALQGQLVPLIPKHKGPGPSITGNCYCETIPCDSFENIMFIRFCCILYEFT